MAPLSIIGIQINHAEKNKFVWPCPGSIMRSRSKWKACCTSTMIVQLIGTKCVQICEAVGQSHTHKVPPSCIKYAGKQSFFVTLSWILNKIKVKMKGMLHIIVQLIGTKYVQICEAVWAESCTQRTTVLNKVCTKTNFFVTFYWLLYKVKVKIKGMLHIYNDCTIDWHQVCANMWSGLDWLTQQSTTPIWDGQMDARTWILCPPSMYLLLVTHH